MGRITELFFIVLNMSITAAFVIVLVILVRQLLKKAPKVFSYMLWILVAFRLLCPFSVSGLPGMFGMGIFAGQSTEDGRMTWSVPETLREIKLAPAVKSVPENKSSTQNGVENAAEQGDARVMASRLNGAEPQTEGAEPQTEGAGQRGSREAASDWVQNIREGNLYLADALAVIWLAGIAVFLLCQFRVWRKLKREVATAVRFGGNIYESDRIREPFVMGIVRPRIYLPFRMEEKERVYILAHERYHIRRHDHQTKFAAVALLAVHWFNPLVWAAYWLMCRDMEMSCDEKVLRMLGGEIKGDYSRSLLTFASERRIPAVSPLAFGETSVKTRIQNILHFRKPGKFAVALGIVVCAAALAAGIGGRVTDTFRKNSERTVSDGSRMVRYGYCVSGNVKSYVIYKEVYLDGRMEEYCVLQTGSVGKNGIPRRGEFDSGYQTTLDLESDEFVREYQYGFAEQQELRSDAVHLQNADPVLAFDGGEKGEKKIETNEGIVFMALNIGGKKGISGFSCEHYMDPEMKAEIIRGERHVNRGAVLYYMVFSDMEQEELEEAYQASPYAQTLFAARNPYIGDAPANGRLLELLRVGDLGSYTMELETAEKQYIIRIHFEDTPGDEEAFENQMYPKAVMLLALIENAYQVEWSYPTTDEDGSASLYTRYFNLNDSVNLVNADGKKDIHELTETLQGVQKLMSYLGT